MATIRKAGGGFISETLNAGTTVATTVADTIGIVGVLSQAGLAKATTFADRVKLGAEADALTNETRVKENFFISHAEFMADIAERAAKVKQADYESAKKLWADHFDAKKK